MPTISQLSSVTQVTPADELPLNQSGVTHSVSVGTLLAGMQPAIISHQGALLGRTSLGPGGPEPIIVGLGLLLSNGTLSVSGAVDMGTSNQNYSISTLAAVTTMATSDLVAVSQGGQDHTITYENFLSGLTIDMAQAAVAVTDSDQLWVAQGDSTMLRQTFAAIWSWATLKLPSYKLQVVEIASNTTLDTTVHNGRVLVCSQPVTISPAAINMGNGFFCDIINLSIGNVTLNTGITTSSGTSALPTGQAASVRCITYSGGTIVFASLSGSAADGGAPSTTLPGQVTGLAITGPTTTSLVSSWTAPDSGGTPSGYMIQYRLSGTTTWIIFASGIVVTNATVTGLTSGASYDFQIYAVNSAGAGLPSTVATGTTATVAGTMISATWNEVPSDSYAHGTGWIGVNAHINPDSAAVQFGFSTSAAVPPTSWTSASYVNSDLWGAYVPTPSTAGTWYAWVEGIDGQTPIVYPVAFTVT